MAPPSIQEGPPHSGRARDAGTHTHEGGDETQTGGTRIRTMGITLKDSGAPHPDSLLRLLGSIRTLSGLRSRLIGRTLSGFRSRLDGTPGKGVPAKGGRGVMEGDRVGGSQQRS